LPLASVEVPRSPRDRADAILQRMIRPLSTITLPTERVATTRIPVARDRATRVRILRRHRG
jgi:hypothetical protein